MTHVATDETRKIVEVAAAAGLAHDTIATLLQVTGKTLRRKYRKELDQGMAKGHFNIGKTTYEKAMAGDRTMLIWYEKTRMGMRETVQVTTPPGEPIEAAVGEPELIGAYYQRLARIAAERRGNPGSDPGVGATGQAANGPAGGPPTREG